MSDQLNRAEDTDLGDDAECALCLAATQAAIASTTPGGPRPETVQDELAFLRAAVDYYQAGMLKRKPMWVPCLVRLHADVRGDFPIGHRSVAAAGVHQAFSNAWGAISVVAADGQRLGVKPAEFEPVRFTRNPAAGCQPSPETQARSAEKAPT